MSVKLTTEQFLNSAINAHGDKFDYSLVNYITARDKVTIICRIHGEFEQLPHNHLSGQGCQKCKTLKTIKRCEINNKQFIERAKLVHGDKYDYSLSNYIKSRLKVTIICKEHGIFEQKANNHLNNRGCPSCAITHFDPNKPAYLYYIKFGNLYKIGITNSKVKTRIQTMKVSKEYTPIIIQELYFENGKDAYNEEFRLHKLYEEFSYTGEPIMKSGYTELYIKDVLGLDVATSQ